MSGFGIRCETSLPGEGDRPPDEIPGLGRRKINPTTPAKPIKPITNPTPLTTPIIIQPDPSTPNPLKPSKKTTIKRKK